MPLENQVSNLKANTTSARAWLQGCIQAMIFGVASAFLSALGVNGAATFNVLDMPPLNIEQLGVIVLSGAAVKLAQFMLAHPLFPSQP